MASKIKHWIWEKNNCASIQFQYSVVPIRRHGSINRRTSFIWPCTFSNIWGVTINWINTQFWSTSRGTFDKVNLAPIAFTFVGVSFKWIVTFSMPWGVTINWNETVGGGGHWFTSGLVLLPSWSEQLYNGHSGSFSLEPVPFALQKLFCLLQLHFVGLEKAWRSCEGEEGLTRVDTPILSLAGSSALHARILISLHTFYKFWK